MNSVSKWSMLVLLSVGLMIGLTQEPSQAQPPQPTPQPKIIGGQGVNLGEFPWMVALINKDGDFQFCGGSLIADRWVLTAGHCFFNRQNQQDTFATDVRIIVGAINVTDGSGQSIDVQRIINHPSYNPADGDRNDNDLALLELVQAADTSSAAVGFISVMDPAVEAQLAGAGTQAIVSGWGATNPDGTASSNTLLKVDVPIVSNQQCAEAAQPATITDNMVCAGGVAGEDSCQGDSGGPLFVANGDNYVQVGLSSFGPSPCAQADDYGVYTRVSRYKSWIDEQIGTVTQNPSASDNLAASPTVTTFPLNTTVDVTNATQEAGEVGCADDDPNSVWYRVSPTQAGQLNVTVTPATGVDPTVGLFSGNGTHPLMEVICVDNGVADDAETIANQPMAANTTYWVRMAAYNPDVGSMSVSLTFTGDGSGQPQDLFYYVPLILKSPTPSVVR